MNGVRDDAVLRLLAELRVMPSDADCSRELRRRCHQQLRTRTQGADLRQRTLDGVVAALSLAYLSQLARMAVLLSR